MIIRELLVKLGLDLDKKTFDGADSAIGKVKAGLGLVAVAAAAAGAFVTSSVEALVENAGKLNDLSQTAGVSAETLQELAYAASLAGGSLEGTTAALTKLSVHMEKAAQGSVEAAQAFGRVGVRIRGADGQLQSAGDVLGDIAEKFKSMPDGARKTALAVDLFGKSGADLIPTLNAGRDGLAQLRAEARELGTVLDQETIAAGDDLGDNLDKLKAAVHGLQYAIAGPLIGELSALSTAMIKWVKENRALIAQRMQIVFRAILGGVRLLVVALNALWKVLGFVIDQWRLFAVILYSVVSAALIWNLAQTGLLISQYLRLAAAAVLAAIRAAAAWAAAAAPVVAIAAALALVILLYDEWLTDQQGGLTLIGQLWPKWKAFLEDFISTSSDDDPWWVTMLKGFVALLLHADVIWAQFKLTIEETFDEIGQWIVSSISKAIDTVTAKIKTSFGGVKNFFGFSPAAVSGGASEPSASPAAVSGGASGPSASVSNTASRTINMGGLKLEQTIVAGVGQTAAGVGESATESLKRWWQGELAGATAAIAK